MLKNKVKNLIFFGIVLLGLVFANNAFAAGSRGVTYAFSGGDDLNARDAFDYYSESGRFYDEYSYYNNNSYNPYNYDPYARGYYEPQKVATPYNPNTTTINRNYNLTTSKSSDTSKTSTKVATSNSGSTKTQATRVSNTTNANNANLRDVNDSLYNNNLGASAFGSIRTGGSGNFMPNTFFGWLIVALLILAIIVLYRVIIRKFKA